MSLVECGLIADDLTKPFHERREVRILVIPEEDTLLVSPWAAAQHQRIWQDILHVSQQDWWKETLAGGYSNALVPKGEPESIWDHDLMVVKQGHEYFALSKTLYTILGCREGECLNIAGKNPMSFDMPRLEAHGWLEPPDEVQSYLPISYHRRCLDPAVLYYQPGDEVLPNLGECWARSGMETIPVLHSALDDARMVCRLLRHRLCQTP